MTTQVTIYDPIRDQWSEGPALPGDDDMEGFGTACCTITEQLYVSTISGKLLRLVPKTNSWETVRRLNTARFFHRMLPLGADQLIFAGGANMNTGKFAQIDILKVVP